MMLDAFFEAVSIRQASSSALLSRAWGLHVTPMTQEEAHRDVCQGLTGHGSDADDMPRERLFVDTEAARAAVVVLRRHAVTGRDRMSMSAGRGERPQGCVPARRNEER